MPFGFASLMGYGPNDLTLESGAGGAITMYVSHKSSAAVVPEIPGVTVNFEPIFVQGGKTVLWGRHDFMRKFDVGIMESTQRFSISPVL